MNRKSRGYQFTASTRLYTSLTTDPAKAKAWRYEGVAFWVTNTATATTPVYQFNSRKTGLPFLTTSTAEKKKFLTAAYRAKWTYKGIPYYLAQ